MDLNTLVGYDSSPIIFRLKKDKETRASLLERERTMNAFDKRAAVKEVNRAITAWYYQDCQ